MSNIGIGPNSFDVNKFNSVKDYLKSFKENLNNLNAENKMVMGGSITETVSRNPALANDTQLASDLSTVLKGKVSMDSIQGVGQAQGISSVDGVAGSDRAAKSFENALGNYMNDVNGAQHESERAMDTYVSGGNIDLHTVMIASEKANLSMQLTMQMRNKILQAYQEVSRMPV